MRSLWEAQIQPGQDANTLTETITEDMSKNAIYMLGKGQPPPTSWPKSL